MDRRRLYGLLLKVQVWLYLPVAAYSLAIAWVAGYQGRYAVAAGVPLFVLLICLVSAGGYCYRLYHPGNAGWPWPGKRSQRAGWISVFWELF